MRLAELMKKGALAGATRKGNPATLATLATVAPDLTPSVAKVATVATLLGDRTPSDAASHWYLPDGREVWLSPPESMEQVQARHPGAIPLPDSVTVTEPGTEAERQAIEYAERVAAIREQGRVPGSYTAITHCRHCGTVPIFAGSPARVDACPWCANRTGGLPIPRPSVSCATCAHFTHDPVGDGGIGSCAAGGPPKGQMPAYPYAKRKCGDFEPKETAQ